MPLMPGASETELAKDGPKLEMMVGRCSSRNLSECMIPWTNTAALRRWRPPQAYHSGRLEGHAFLWAYSRRRRFLFQSRARMSAGWSVPECLVFVQSRRTVMARTMKSDVVLRRDEEGQIKGRIALS